MTPQTRAPCGPPWTPQDDVRGGSANDVAVQDRHKAVPVPCCGCPDVCSPWLEDGKGLVILGRCRIIEFRAAPLLGGLPSPTASRDP